MKRTEDGTIVLKFSILWFFAVIIMIALLISFFRNYILATNEGKEQTETSSIVAFEENQKSVDIIQVMIQNTNSDKKLINEQREIEFKTQYEDNPNLPLGEEQVKQEGKVGKVQVTALQEIKDGQMVNEEIIENVIVEEVVPKIIYKGTSQFLNKYKVHLGDQMYLLEAEDLKENMADDATTLTQIPRYLNVKLEEQGDEWIKVAYNEKEGYIKTSHVTSEAVTPIITEKNRIATLKTKLNSEMDLSVPSGLTLSDYRTILANNVSDVNKIFEQNVETFYNIEQKYKINGVFVIAIGIHESAWGTSKIATDKNNLFGFTAYDSDPYNSASQFDTYANAINKVAETLATKYLHPAGTIIGDNIICTGTYYNGTTAKSVNMRYASDEFWSEKVFNYMQYLYNKL